MYTFLGILLCLISFSWSDITQDSIVQAQKVDSLHTYWTSHLISLDSAQISQNLSIQSNEWFESIEQSVRSDRKEDLEKQPFANIISVMVVRMYLRADSLKDNTAPSIKQFLLKKGPIPRSLSKITWGPARVEGREASKGLISSPNVGVMFYTFEEGRWKINLNKSLPLIMRGLETVGVKKGVSSLETSLLLLKMALATQSDSRLKADESLWEP